MGEPWHLNIETIVNMTPYQIVNLLESRDRNDDGEPFDDKTNFMAIQTRLMGKTHEEAEQLWNKHLIKKHS